MSKRRRNKLPKTLPQWSGELLVKSPREWLESTVAAAKEALETLEGYPEEYVIPMLQAYQQQIQFWKRTIELENLYVLTPVEQKAFNDALRRSVKVVRGTKNMGKNVAEQPFSVNLGEPGFGVEIKSTKGPRLQ